MYVSMPSAGYSHFYVEQSVMWKSRICSVNALGGLFSFLPGRLDCYYADVRCQCPRRAILISTQLSYLVSYNPVVECQCPRRAILISTKISMGRDQIIYLVSMPSAGYSHFYSRNYHSTSMTIFKCQCPRRAILISTG